MNARLFITSVVLALFMTACQYNSIEESNPIEETPTSNNLVDQRLNTYFSNFETAALARGYDIDLNELEITGEISNIPESGVAGTCQYGQHLSHVTIDLDFWNNSSNNFREFVVFHELGHCVLHRDHREDAFNNGICRSIMRSGLEDCRDAYSPTNREYYLDELFTNAEF